MSLEVLTGRHTSATAAKCSALQYRGGFSRRRPPGTSTASQSALSPVLLGFEQGSSTARRRFGRQGCHHAGVPGFYWAILDLCRWASLRLKSSARRTTYHKVSRKGPLFCFARLLSLSSERCCWSFTPSCPVSKVTFLPERHFQGGGRFRSGQNRSSTPQWGKARVGKRVSSRDECLTEPLFSFYL
jgi:hypothetical protein